MFAIKTAFRTNHPTSTSALFYSCIRLYNHCDWTNRPAISRKTFFTYLF